MDSTNNYALSRVYAGLAQHGTAIFSHEQVAGKGQRGKSWISKKGDNLAVSLILNPTPLQLQEQFMLSICIAVSAHKILTKYLGDDVRIKWPNDLYWQDRKAGGILIENSVQGNSWKWAVAGIGVNINQVVFPTEVKNPVSFKQITGRDHDPLIIAKELCHAVLDEFQSLPSDKEIITGYYKSKLFRIGEEVKLKAGNRIFNAIIKDVTADGKLIVNHGLDEEFSIGEIEWL